MISCKFDQAADYHPAFSMTTSDKFDFGVNGGKYSVSRIRFGIAFEKSTCQLFNGVKNGSFLVEIFKSATSSW